MTLKYIVVKDRNDEEHAIVFPAAIMHKHVARIHRVSDVRVVSAGMRYIGTHVQAFGRSDSLGIDSRPEDAAILSKDFSR